MFPEGGIVNFFANSLAIDGLFVLLSYLRKRTRRRKLTPAFCPRLNSSGAIVAELGLAEQFVSRTGTRSP